MKKLFLAALAMSLFVGCEYDDSEIWGEIGKLREEVNQNSEDIATLSALVEALDKGKLILSTEQTAEGVILHFTDGSSVVVKNGANGKDGADGKDGKDGADGKDGQDGADGKDGLNGADGKDGKDGADGDSFFVSVEEDENTVTITLADGRVIVLPKATEGSGSDEPQMRILSFEDADAKFTPYTLDYCSKSIATWSDLVDDAQYMGTMTYDSNSSTYYWYDEGNTELFHSFTTPYWTGGHAVSNYVIADYTTLPEGNFGWYELQFSNPIGGHNGSANFCVHNGYSDFFNSQIYDASLKGFEFADGVARVIDHMYITNTCYVLNSLTIGDGFAPPATEQTLFKVVAYGYDAADNLTGSCEFILCQGTNPVTDWQKWELKSLGKVAKVLFNFEPSSDLVGDYGMNTPAYFAYDDVAVIF